MASKNCYHYRCSKCQARRSLRHILAWYTRRPKCRRCGGTRFYFDKTYAIRRAAATCRCSGIHHPHRIGMITKRYGVCQHAAPERASCVKGWWPAADGIGTWVQGEYIPF